MIFELKVLLYSRKCVFYYQFVILKKGEHKTVVQQNGKRTTKYVGQHTCTLTCSWLWFVYMVNVLYWST